MSGAKADRPGLKDALEFARKDDTIAVWRLDRLGRSLKDLIALVEEGVWGAVERQIHLRVEFLYNHRKPKRNESPHSA
jgi:hypothetical protein